MNLCSLAVRFILHAEVEEPEALQKKAYLGIAGWDGSKGLHKAVQHVAGRAAVSSVNHLTVVGS